MYTDQKKKGNNDKRALLLHSTTHTNELFKYTAKFSGYMYIDIIFVVGPLAFTIIGSIVAFLSGLIFSLNNFLVKATRADFGEVLAVRCLIQIPLMGTIAILNGTSKTFWMK